MAEVLIFPKGNKMMVSEAEELLTECFPDSYIGHAGEEMRRCLSDERIAVAAVEGRHLLGFAGAIPQYGNTGWELHPIAVFKAYQRKGIGTLLVKALEAETAARGGIAMYLGTDDEYGQTSLSGTDLYEDLYGKITGIRNIGSHPFEFYQKCGYMIVGAIPDANGSGKPDIIMAKRIAAR